MSLRGHRLCIAAMEDGGMEDGGMISIDGVTVSRCFVRFYDVL